MNIKKPYSKKLTIIKPRVTLKYHHKQANSNLTSNNENAETVLHGNEEITHQNGIKQGTDDVDTSNITIEQNRDVLIAKLNEILCKDGKFSMPKLKLINDNDLEQFDNSNYRILCTLCKRLFDDRAQYLTHMEAHRRADEVQCHYCGLIFPDLHKFMEHEYEHTQKDPFVCQRCGSGFLTYKNYQTHVRRHRKDEAGELLPHRTQFTCLLCLETFRNRSLLIEHEHVHYITCPGCGMNAHYKQLQFECIECCSVFIIQQSTID